MATLTPNLSTELGGSGVSALLKSAASAAASQASYEDEIQSFNFKNGDQGSDAYNTYTGYLQGRISQLQTSGSVSDLSKALTLQQTLIDAGNTYNTNQIQNASIGIQEGTYSDSEKAMLLRNLANQAYASGSVQEGQTLESQYNSTILTLQNQATAASTSAQSANNASYSNYTKQFSDLTTALSEQLANGSISGAKYYQALDKTLQAKASFLKEVSDPSNPLGLDADHLATAGEAYDSLMSGGDLNKAHQMAQEIAAGAHPVGEEQSNGAAKAFDLPNNGNWKVINGTPVYDTTLQGNTNFATTKGKNAEGQSVYAPATGAATSLTKVQMVDGDQLPVRYSKSAGDFGVDPQTGDMRLLKDIPGEAGFGTQQEVTPTGTVFNAYVLGKNGQPTLDKNGQPIRNFDPNQSYALNAQGNVQTDKNGKPVLLNKGNEDTGGIPDILQALGTGLKTDIPAILHQSGSLLGQASDFVTQHHIANNLPNFVQPGVAALQTLISLATTHANQIKQANITAQQQAAARSTTNTQLAQQAAARMAAEAQPGPTVAGANAAKPSLPFPNPVPANTPNAPAVQEQHTVANINESIGGVGHI